MARQITVKQAFFTLEIDENAVNSSDKYKIGKTIPSGTYDEATFVDLVGAEFMVSDFEKYINDGRIEAVDINDASKKIASKYSAKVKK